jgi:hypothetical protein
MWSGDGDVPFTDDRRSSTAHHVPIPDEVAASRVPALSLATLLRERVRSDVDLLKVDIEGAEEAVLCQEPALLQSVGAVAAELHPERCDQQRVLRVLRETYRHVYRVSGRGSSKPLVIATRMPMANPSLEIF